MGPSAACLSAVGVMALPPAVGVVVLCRRTTSTAVRGVGVAVVVVAGVWAMLVLLSFLRYNFCVYLFRVLVVLGVLLVFVTWSFTGLVFGFAIVTADACEHPEQTVAALLNASPPPTPNVNDSTSLEATLYYYLSCDVVRP